MLKGIDASHYQGVIDFDQLRPHIDFIIIAAGYGVEVIDGPGFDSQFTRNLSEARRVGLPFHLYHYCYPQFNSPEDEALSAANISRKFGITEKLWADFEESSYTGDHVDWVNRFQDRYALLMGNKPGEYLNANEINTHNYQPSIDKGYELWLADYVTNPNPSIMPDGSPWKTVRMWQYADTSSLPGISGVGADLNVYYGTLEEFQGKGGGDTVQPQDRIVEAFNNLLGRDPEQAELDVWKAAGEPEPRGWAWSYIQIVNSGSSPRHGNLWQQLETHLNVHDANDIQRLIDQATQPLKDQLAKAQQTSGMPTATAPSGQTGEWKSKWIVQTVSGLAALLGVVDPTSLPQWIQALMIVLGGLGVVLPEPFYQVYRARVKIAALTGK
jgi:GH25 family lysozyme M1 (1,4-beta-N-acetylmuramidase)